MGRVPRKKQPGDDVFARMGQRLKAAMREAGLNQTEFAQAMNVGKTAVSRWFTGENRIDLAQLNRAADLLGKPTAWFLDAPPELDPAPEEPPPMLREFARQVAEEIARLNRGEERRLPVFSAGPGAPADAESFREVVTGIAHGRLKPIEVTGDCLWPRLMPGWIVWINPEGSPRHGDVVAIEENDERGLREYEKRNGEVWLTARRNHQPAKHDPERTRILGVIELVQHSP
jgi:transcriptional regulator with XRE-family HTH domain